MKHIKPRKLVHPQLLLSATVISVCAWAMEGFAADPDSRPAAPAAEETLVLSPFMVSSEGVGGYQMDESTAGGRVRASTFETTQPVTVVTRNFIDDVGTGVLLDALKYVSGITQSSQPVGADRMSVRGFQVNNTGLIDGFDSASQNHWDPALFDRFEVVKGPNAIISPSGAPGGTVNLVSKSPQFGKNSGSIQMEAGRYDSNRANVDVNRILNKNLAYRVVLAGQQDDGYNHYFMENFNALAGLTWRFWKSSELTFKFIYQHTWDQNFAGIPIDPTADTSTSDPRPYPGLARDANIGNDDDVRFSEIRTYEALYTQKISENLSMRLAAQISYDSSWFNQFDTGLFGAAQGDYDPTTGAWVYGVLFRKTAPYDIIGSAATPSPIFQRSTSGVGRIPPTRKGLQNDWVYEIKTDRISSQTAAGFAYNAAGQPGRYSESLIRSTANPVTGLDTFNIFGPYKAPISGIIVGSAPRIDQDSNSTTRQVYGSQVLKFFKNRLIVNGGLSQSWFKYHLLDRRTPSRSYDTSFQGELQKSYGVVLAPVPNTVIYYGHSEVTTFNSAGVPPSPQTQDSRSDELGIRQKFIKGRATVSLAYFDTKQNNTSIPNPANLDPSRLGLPALPGLYTDRVAHGWEFEFNAAVTKELSVVGNYTWFKNRDANGVVFRATAEKSGALWLQYNFKTGVAKGFGAGLGANYLDRRPGDSPRAGFTSASTVANPIYYQPTFWIPARTLMDLTFSYRVDSHWSARLFINNVLNKDHIEAALNRYSLVMGGERNYRLQLTYSF